MRPTAQEIAELIVYLREQGGRIPSNLDDIPDWQNGLLGALRGCFERSTFETIKAYEALIPVAKRGVFSAAMKRVHRDASIHRTPNNVRTIEAIKQIVNTLEGVHARLQEEERSAGSPVVHVYGNLYGDIATTKNASTINNSTVENVTTGDRARITGAVEHNSSAELPVRANTSSKADGELLPERRWSAQYPHWQTRAPWLAGLLVEIIWATVAIWQSAPWAVVVLVGILLLAATATLAAAMALINNRRKTTNRFVRVPASPGLKAVVVACAFVAVGGTIAVYIVPMSKSTLSSNRPDALNVDRGSHRQLVPGMAAGSVAVRKLNIDGETAPMASSGSSEVTDGNMGSKCRYTISHECNSYTTRGLIQDANGPVNQDIFEIFQICGRILGQQIQVTARRFDGNSLLPASVFNLRVAGDDSKGCPDHLLSKAKERPDPYGDRDTVELTSDLDFANDQSEKYYCVSTIGFDVAKSRDLWYSGKIRVQRFCD